MDEKEEKIEETEEVADTEYSKDDTLDDSVISEETQGETIKKLREKLKKALDEKQQYLTAWQKDKADFLNARKRDKEDKEHFVKFANENLIVELLPVLQSFEMAFANKEAWEKIDKNWRTGVEYIYNQLKTVLESNGLKQIDPIGKKFDPMRDEAIEYVPVSDEKQDHVITDVIQKGYEFHGKTLVAPKVRVGAKPN